MASKRSQGCSSRLNLFIHETITETTGVQVYCAQAHHLNARLGMLLIAKGSILGSLLLEGKLSFLFFTLSIFFLLFSLNDEA